LAPKYELYDLDVCNGHAALGEYHHHHSPICLARRLNDTGSGHSPVYGWINDGYPIYGPYQAKDTIAQSCWFARNYSSKSPTGCSNSKRCCTLNNPEDYTQGTTTVTCGPSLTGTTTTQSSNTISAASGIFIEDYYYNSSCGSLGGVYLDKHNGHSHGSYGYHYHVTITSKESWGPVFPFFVGPKLYGCQQSGACCTSQLALGCSNTGSVCGTSLASSTHSCTTGSWSGSTSMDDDKASSGDDDYVTTTQDDGGVTNSTNSTGSDGGLSQEDKVIIISVVTVVGTVALVGAAGFVMMATSSVAVAGAAASGSSAAVTASSGAAAGKAAVSAVAPHVSIAMVEVKSGGSVLV
jgi:hypothetical protein